MTWRCHGATNQEMVDKLKEAGIITTDSAEAAMRAIDRGRYCCAPNPYLDRPREIGFNVTISAPHMHAYALSILTDQLKDGARALDIGSGSGYLTACMGYMVGPRGKVVGVEHIQKLIEKSISNLLSDCPHFINESRVKFIEADGRAGYAPDAPYDAIHVGAAAQTIPEELVKQLAPGGRMVIPVVAMDQFQGFQQLIQVDKHQNGTVTNQKLMFVAYVPLTDATSQLNH